MTIPEFLDALAYGVAPETSKPALDWLAERNNKFGIFINNECHAVHRFSYAFLSASEWICEIILPRETW